MTTILQTAGGFKESTFTKFYKKSIVKREQFGQASLSQIWVNKVVNLTIPIFA